MPETQTGAKTMGAFDAKAGEACTGDDILAQLNHVFGYSHFKIYQYAKDHNNFGTVPNAPGNYKDLIKAYECAGLEVTLTWRSYLRALGTVHAADPQQGPQNIYDIAQFRDHCLKNDLGMSTITHTPHHGGHVHTKPGTGIEPEVVDSPFPV